MRTALAAMAPAPGGWPGSCQPVEAADRFHGSGFMAERTSENFYQAVTKGLPPDMPSFNAQLSEEERWALADYLRMLTFVPSGEPAQRRPSSPPRLPRSPRRPGLWRGRLQPPILPGRPVHRPRVRPRTVAARGRFQGRHDPRVGEHGSGGDVPKDLVVTLHGFDEMQSVITGTATLQADGSFIF